MKHLFFLVGFTLLATGLLAQLPADSIFPPYYHQRLTHFQTLPKVAGEIVFVGNSLTDGAEWSELFGDPRIKNRGISGDVTAGVLHRLDEVGNRKPAKVFLLIGTNDLARGIGADSVLRNILRIVAKLKLAAPATGVYVQSILPVNPAFGKFQGHMTKALAARQVNKLLQDAAVSKGYTFVDLYASFADSSSRLDAAYTNDGLHLNGAGYQLLKHLLYPYVYDAAPMPSLIPQPRQVSWKKEKFPLYAASGIVALDSDLRRLAYQLQERLQDIGLRVPILPASSKGNLHIELALAKVAVPHHENEAYHIQVTGKKVALTANTAQGIFNGMQTLLQLCRSSALLDGVDITDWPAFSVRGFMTDVGRNYQSIRMLQQQIEVMSRYKLNLFQFHLTEDIAWRLAVKRYPQLTSPQHMLRDPGLYYTEAELKQLIRFCKDRFIELVPEIDMPGHSAAFRRAMGFDMQSDSGLVVMQQILRDFCATYDVGMIHIGGDEVKITRPDFMPAVTNLLHGLGKKTMGWSPGSNLLPGTLRQLWMDDKIADSTLPYVDSRHFYLNHMDPLEAVVTLFHRQVGNADQETAVAKGAILCVWHDRRAATENDILQLNPVYPGILSFAHRVWQGGGRSGMITNSQPGAEAAAFASFEQSLIDHKNQYFKGLPFPYTRQAQMVWSLYGPFDNKGATSTSFSPEQKVTASLAGMPALQAIGGTVVLRHWWHPVVKGVLPIATEKSTWYATTRIWADEAGYRSFWIGFNNLSRSPATDSPPEGSWNNLGSAIWVNDTLIAPPQWRRAGRKGHAEEPLLDEGYEYRPPARIYLKAGWNQVLVKAPINTFKGADWQNPVKWMFSFVPAPEAGSGE